MERRGEFDFEMFRAVLWRRRLWWLVPLVAVLALSAVFTNSQPDRYVAVASVVIDASPAEELVQANRTNVAAAEREIGNEVRLALSGRVRDAVAEQLGEEPTIDVVPDRDADVLEFRGTGSTPEEAAEVANTWATTYVTIKRNDAAASISSATDDLRGRLSELRNDRQVTRAPLDVLDEQLQVVEESERATLERERERLAFDLGPELDAIALEEGAIIESLTQLQIGSLLALEGTAGVIDEAIAPEEASGLSGFQSLAVAGLVGAVLGIGLAILRDVTDSKIRTAEDLERAASSPLLAVIPVVGRRGRRGGSVNSVFGADGQLIEAFQDLRSAIDYAVRGDRVQILVTSAMPAEGKTTTAAHLALALARSGAPTVAVDADLRRPRLHEMFDVRNRRGVAEFMQQDTDPRQLFETVTSEGGTVRVLPAGRTSEKPSRLLAAGGLDALLTDPTFTSMVVDSPPILPVSDTLSLARSVDGVILVARAGKSSTGDVREASSALRRRGAPLLGVVLVGGSSANRYGYYGDAEVREEPSIDLRDRETEPPAHRSSGGLFSEQPNGTASNGGRSTTSGRS